MGVTIALVTSSRVEQTEAKPANLYYRKSRSGWVDAVLRYMEAREFQKEHIFFVYAPKSRIIGYDEMVEPYPVTKEKLKTEDRKEFAQKILDWILSTYNKPHVELHVGKVISDPLIPLLKQHGISYKLFAEGLQILRKPKKYENLIQHELEVKKWREYQRGARTIVSEMRYRTPENARRILEKWEHEAVLYEVEDIYEEIRQYLKKHDGCVIQAKKALAEFEKVLNKLSASDADDIMEYLERIQDISEFYLDQDKYEKMKSRYGKEIARYTTYLRKKNYVTIKANRLSEIQDKLIAVLLMRANEQKGKSKRNKQAREVMV